MFSRPIEAIKLLWLLIVLVGCGLTGTHTKLQWRISSPLPEPRGGYAAGILDEKLIIAGGTYWEGAKGRWIRKKYSSRTDAFDPKTEFWTRLPDMPTALGYSASVVVDDQLYVIGGYTGDRENNKVYTLRKTQNRYLWAESGELPQPKLFARALPVGRSIALLGGTTRFEPYDASGTCCTSQSATRDLLFLNLSQPQLGWKAHPPFPGPERWLFSAESDAMSIWMIGGIDQKVPDGPVTQYDELWRYDLSQKTWSRTAALPREAHNATPISSVLFEGRLFLIGFSKRVWEFNMVTREFTDQSPLPREAFVDRFFWVNGQILGAGGENKLEGPRRRSEWTFIGEFGVLDDGAAFLVSTKGTGS